jgi:hypothetical protein
MLLAILQLCASGVPIQVRSVSVVKDAISELALWR